jgi:hypothetical protein
MPDVLAVWLASINAAADPVTFFDWGNVANGMAVDKFFRIKNLSTAFAATGITITLTDPGGGSEDTAIYHYLSTDGLRFTANVVVPNLPPQGVSDVLTLRAVIPARAVAGTQPFQVNLNVSAWGASASWPAYALVP